MDYIVNLYEIDFEDCDSKYKVVRALSPNSDKIIEFIKENFNDGWASEVKAALYKNNPTCFIAIDNAEIIGFACYDATAKGFFGPTGVKESYRGNGVGKTLFMETLKAMKNDGYGYSIIGWANDRAVKFYQKNANAMPLNNTKSVYDRLIK